LALAPAARRRTIATWRIEVDQGAARSSNERRARGEGVVVAVLQSAGCRAREAGERRIAPAPRLVAALAQAAVDGCDARRHPSATPVERRSSAGRIAAARARAREVHEHEALVGWA
jgi:hypothetical protein